MKDTVVGTGPYATILYYTLSLWNYSRAPPLPPRRQESKNYDIFFIYQRVSKTLQGLILAFVFCIYSLVKIGVLFEKVTFQLVRIAIFGQSCPF
jgi:hypothetical protein